MPWRCGVWLPVHRGLLQRRAVAALSAAKLGVERLRGTRMELRSRFQSSGGRPRSPSTRATSTAASELECAPTAGGGATPPPPYAIGIHVPLLVLGDLLGPVVRVGACRGVMLRAAVPEAAIDEHGNLLPGENEIGSAARSGAAVG